MAQVIWNIFRLLWSWTPGFYRYLLGAWAYRPASRFWRARVRSEWYQLLHRVNFSTPLSIRFRQQVRAWAASGLSLSSARSGRPSLYLLFRRILTWPDRFLPLLHHVTVSVHPPPAPPVAWILSRPIPS